LSGVANPQDRIPASDYRRMQRALPGVETLYHLLRSLADARLQAGNTVLIVGAGGGREIETLLPSPLRLQLIGCDPSPAMLGLAHAYGNERVTLHEGLIDAVPTSTRAALATSLLVMHFLPDDGAKLDYLGAIRARMALGAALMLADATRQNAMEWQALAPLFLAHAELMGLNRDQMQAGLAVLAGLPLISAERTMELLHHAGFAQVVPLFQGLWYRGWMATAV
jgi:tRNA (cmo5U34)-methyltransferase